MSNMKLKNLKDVAEATQLVNDFKFVKKAYFELKHKHLSLIEVDRENVDDDYWEDENFEDEYKLFEERKKLYDEAQELYKNLKLKLDNDQKETE